MTAGERMPEAVVIARRFNGPPASAQGGYACGLGAGLVDGPVEVRLRAPPPLETPLSVHRLDGGGVALTAGDATIVEAIPSDPLELDVPAPVSQAQAEAGAAACRWVERHPFPTCFGCGPEREPGDGMRLLLGPVAGREVVAAPWVPDPSIADEDGIVPAIFMWAALDCPTSQHPDTLADAGPCVLATMRARLDAPVRAESPHAVIAWAVARHGRRRRGGAAIHDAHGRLCGLAEGIWIELRDPSVVGARVAD